MATKISEVTADANWLAQSQIARNGGEATAGLSNRESQIAPWLRSLPTVPLKRKPSGGNLRATRMPVPCWLSKANWAVAKLCSPKASWPNWEAAPQSRVRPLRSYTNTTVGDFLFIISISFVWKIENQPRSSG